MASSRPHTASCRVTGTSCCSTALQSVAPDTLRIRSGRSIGVAQSNGFLCKTRSVLTVAAFPKPPRASLRWDSPIQRRFDIRVAQSFCHGMQGLGKVRSSKMTWRLASTLLLGDVGRPCATSTSTTGSNLASESSNALRWAIRSKRSACRTSRASRSQYHPSRNNSLSPKPYPTPMT